MISIDSAQIDAWIVAFIFPLSRILGFIVTAPLWSSNGVPRRVRLVLGLAITIALTPSLPPMPAVQPASLGGLWIMAQQLLIGVGMGFAVKIVFTAFHMAGEFIGTCPMCSTPPAITMSKSVSMVPHYDAQCGNVHAANARAGALPPSIILTTFDDDDYVFDALRYGASGYLLKGVSVDGLTNAVREAARGGSIIAPDVASKVLQMFSRMAQGDVQVRVNKKNALELTKMEWQVIREVGCGLSNKEIAGRLYLSEGTVRNYISSILRKLELRDRTQLAIWAVQNQNSQPEADV